MSLPRQPAFPTTRMERTGLTAHMEPVHYAGMDLRDYFAAKIAATLMMPGASQDNHHEKIAANAYAVADAMMLARRRIPATNNPATKTI